jgi:predicted membrane protein
LQGGIEPPTFAEVKPGKHVTQACLSDKILKTMNTNKKNILSIFSAIVLIAGSGVLLERTVNSYFNAISPFIVALSVFIYMLGASLMGRCSRKGGYPSYFVERPQNGTIFAFLLIAGGLLLLSFNTQFLNPSWKPFLFSWPMLLFVIGAGHICRNRFTSGVILCVIGYFFLIEKASKIFPGNLAFKQFASTYWPALMIVAGIFLFLRLLTGRPGRFRRTHRGKEPVATGENENSDGKINCRFVCSGTEQVILDPVFKGGTIDVICGGVELDLRRTSLAEGNTLLHVKAICGGVEIIAPDHWEIEIHSKAFVGGVHDSRIKNSVKDPARKLVLIANATFGGIEIK